MREPLNLTPTTPSDTLAADHERQKALDYLDRFDVFGEIGVTVKTVAHSVHRRFNQYLSYDDAHQCMWEWVMSAPKKIARWHQDNTMQDFHRMLGAVLYDEGTFLGRKQKADILCYKQGDEFYYTKAMLTGTDRKPGLLHAVFDEEAWINPPQELTGGRSGKALNEGFGWVATLSDISRALSKLPKEYQNILKYTYGEGGMSRTQLAEHQRIPPSTATSRHTAAVKRLWSELGGPRWLTSSEDRAPDEGHWPAGRRALSNEGARALTAREAAHDARPRRES